MCILSFPSSKTTCMQILLLFKGLLLLPILLLPHFCKLNFRNFIFPFICRTGRPFDYVCIAVIRLGSPDGDESSILDGSTIQGPAKVQARQSGRGTALCCPGPHGKIVLNLSWTIPMLLFILIFRPMLLV